MDVQDLYGKNFDSTINKTVYGIDIRIVIKPQYCMVFKKTFLS